MSSVAHNLETTCHIMMQFYVEMHVSWFSKLRAYLTLTFDLEAKIHGNAQHLFPQPHRTHVLIVHHLCSVE